MLAPVPQWQMPVGRYSAQDKDSFAYTTAVKRWPAIITNIISTMSNEVHQLSIGSSSDATNAKTEEGKEIIKALSTLKYEVMRNKVLTPIEQGCEPNVDCYNADLEAAAGSTDTWLTANWLFAECYLYRRIREIFAQRQGWKLFDPFFASKEETYRSSSTAIVHLATSLLSLEEKKDEVLKGWEKEGSALEILYMEMMQAALWGNATDLSMLVNATFEDIQKLQSVGAAAQAESAKMILRNDFAKTWEYVKTLENGRLDVVLDNAGFELYTDLIMADFLVSYTPFFKTVTIHPKVIPWFVSDTLPYDFTWAVDVLSKRDFFPGVSESDLDLLGNLSRRWRKHIEDGTFQLSVPLDLPLGKGDPKADFWTTPYAYQDMPSLDPDLLQELRKSDLVIFKGDLNYRKLVGDGKWEPDTPFETALGPLAGQLTLLSLRTNKADPIVGLDTKVAAKTAAEAPDYKISGKYAVVSFSKAT